MPETVLQIVGMTCDHCVKSVKDALLSVPGVREVEVSLEGKSAKVLSEGPLNLEEAQKAVEMEGYRAQP